MNHLGLFEGIGGFSLAARWMGWQTKAWVEINPFSQSILKKHFQDAEGHDDIHTFDGKKWTGKIDIITGGFPCQPFSHAGKRKGEEDERYLWDEMLRVIREVKPTFVIGENVAGIVSMDNGKTLSKILSDLEGEGYQVQPFTIPACAVQAPHRRDRVWIIAYSAKNGYSPQRKSEEIKRVGSKNNGIEKERREPSERFNGFYGLSRVVTSNGNDILQSGKLDTRGSNETTKGSKRGNKQERQTSFGERFRNKLSDSNKTFADSDSKRPSRQGKHRGQLHTKQNQEREINRVINANQFEREWYEVATEFCRMDDGFPKGLDKFRKDRLKALGNAIVPQVAFEIFKSLEMLGEN